MRSEDLISREKAYEVLSEYYHHKTKMQHKALREALDRVPPVDIDLSDYSDRLWRNAYEQGKADAEPRKKGKWTEAKPRSGKLGWVCSCCDHEAYWDSDYGQQLFRWCPWCGADIRGEDDG